MKTAVVTGGTAGMGLEIARGLLRAGIATTIVGRRIDEASAALAPDAISAPFHTIRADFASMADVRRTAGEIAARGPLDILVNNAGAQFKMRQVTADGLERTMAINHFAPFLLTALLLDQLHAAAAARIVNVGSSIHQMVGRIDFDDLTFARRYSVARSYALSKLGNLLFTRELALRLAGTSITANSFNPGGIRTGFNRFLKNPLLRPFTATPEEAAKTALYLALAEDIPGRTGGYFDRKNRLCAPSPLAGRPEIATRLWEVSDELLGQPWREALAP